MSNYAGPLYETSYVVSDDAVAELDAWLAEVLEAARQHDGIESARYFEAGTDTAGHAIRTCQYQARDDNTLDKLIDGLFSSLDAEAAVRFGANVVVYSRALRPDEVNELPTDESTTCLNCGTRLRGQYCGSCGQRSRTRLISIWQLLREAFGDLLELDSRLWRTVIPLLTRPGQLTKDYLEGRRARYMPPFRTYLVLSVMFFVVAFFDPKEDLSLFFEPEPLPTAEEIAEAKAAAEAAAAEQKRREEAARKRIDEIKAAKVIPDSVIDEIIDDDDDFNVSIGDNGISTSSGGLFDNCDEASIQTDKDVPEWIQKRFSDERIKQICERNKARGNENFAEAIIDNVPVALIVLLPLMALVLKLLYPLSRRYFVEHLLFVVHFHAFFFLILMLQIIFARVATWLSLAGTISTIIIVATSFYIPVYLYKAMRRVYAQGHLITIVKYLMLLAAYGTGAVLTMLGVLLVALMSA
jgi:hypothetical protein